MLGLHAFKDEAALVRVLPDDFPNIVRVLVPDDRAEPRGFHNLLIEDLSATEDCHDQPASAGDLTVMKQQGPSSLLSGMTKCQVDMESLHRDCKCKLAVATPETAPIVACTSTQVCPVTL